MENVNFNDLIRQGMLRMKTDIARSLRLMCSMPVLYAEVRKKGPGRGRKNPILVRRNLVKRYFQSK